MFLPVQHPFLLFVSLAIFFSPEKHSLCIYDFLKFLFKDDGFYPFEGWARDSIEPIRYISQNVCLK